MQPKLNKRRCDLIHREHFGPSLTRAEKSELRKLQKQSGDELKRELQPAIKFVRKLLRSAKP